MNQSNYYAALISILLGYQQLFYPSPYTNNPQSLARLINSFCLIRLVFLHKQVDYLQSWLINAVLTFLLQLSGSNNLLCSLVMLARLRLPHCVDASNYTVDLKKETIIKPSITVLTPCWYLYTHISTNSLLKWLQSIQQRLRSSLSLIFL